MNIAFPVLILTLALLPGFLFRDALLRGTFRRSPITAQHVAGDVAWLVLGSIVVHSLVGFLFSLGDWGPRADVLAGMLTGNYGKDGALVYDLARDFSARPWAYFGYVLVSGGLAYGAGLLAHTLIRRRRLDLSRPELRLPNDWYYLLEPRANIRVFDETPVVPDVYLTAIVENKDAAYLYRGIVRDWVLTSSGDLDWVMLDEVFRRPLSQDRSGEQEHSPKAHLDDRYYGVIGDRFILTRSEMRTLNLQYIFAAYENELEDGGPSATPATSVPASSLTAPARPAWTRGLVLLAALVTFLAWLRR